MEKFSSEHLMLSCSNGCPETFGLICDDGSPFCLWDYKRVNTNNFKRFDKPRNHSKKCVNKRK